ncbi:hypothetical protein [Phenylobacterium sp.]|uniref:hypothetical protein n=1 Tax=Phenylobacterium sp. TaxID=1871053 RepID=UPI002737BDA4|nr:hypothetical protein [Phenylobacterium sp.]MDP3869920.1 hypothetical protein [Phenylobacterium sp.]
MDLTALSEKVGRMIRQTLTGADKETLAIGRVVSLPYLIATLALPFAMLSGDRPVSLAEAGIYIGAVAGGFMALVRGTSATEPPA